MNETPRTPDPWFFFAEAFDAMIVLETQSGRIVDVNEAWCGLTGYDRDEVIGRSSVDLGLWSDPERRDEAVAQARRGEFDGAEMRLSTRSGEIRIVEGRARVVDVGGVEYTVATARDITEIRELLVLLEGTSREVREALVEALREGPVQPLAAAMVRLDVLERSVVDAATSNELAAIGTALRTAMERARGIIHSLDPGPISSQERAAPSSD